MDWLQWGTEKQTEQRKAWMHQNIVWRVTSQQSPIDVVIADATVGEGERDTLGDAIEIDVTYRDFIFEFSHCPPTDNSDQSPGKRQMPSQGDEIRWTVNGVEVVFTVEERGQGGRVWHWHDNYHKEIRVHTTVYDLPNGVVLS